MNIKNKKIKIFLFLFVFLLLGITVNSVNAAITSDENGGVGVDQGAFHNVTSSIVELAGFIGTISANSVFSTVTVLTNLLALVMFLGLQGIFSLAANDVTHMPMPDTLVFNRIAFFDPNFVDPAKGSLAEAVGETLRDLFGSFQIIATSIFIIAAMIVGIKLALSSVASKKALYKEAALKWLTGFLILLCLKWIVAGIFYLNEVFVSRLYSIIATQGFSIPVHFIEAVPLFGRLIQDFLGWIADVTGNDGWNFALDVQGFLGIALANICRGVGGDLIASLVGFVIMGQSLTIVGSYLKRAFMCSLLGVISPLVVAIDTITSAQGKQSQIFKNWLKNFAVAVFIQSLHAMYMVVIIRILSKLYRYNNHVWSGNLKQEQVSILTIMLLTGLVKFEKLFKTMFGIGDSFAGDLKDGAKSMVKAMGAAKGLSEGLKAVSDNSGKVKAAGKRKSAFMAELNNLKAGLKPGGNINITNNNSTDNSSSNTDNSSTSNSQNNNNGGRSSSGGGSNSSGDYLDEVLKKKSNPTSLEDKIRMLEEAIAEETAKEKSARLAMLMGPSNVMAGIGLGLGLGDDISEALFKGGYITKGLDYAAEKVGYKAADKDRKKFYEDEKKDGEKYGYTPSEGIVRDKSTVQQLFTNPQIYFNPTAVGKEHKRQMTELGEMFGETMKRKMRDIDRDLDNQ